MLFKNQSLRCLILWSVSISQSGTPQLPGRVISFMFIIFMHCQNNYSGKYVCPHFYFDNKAQGSMAKERPCVGSRGAETGLMGRRKAALHPGLRLVFWIHLHLNLQAPLCLSLTSPCSPCPARAKISPIFLTALLVMAWMFVPPPPNSYFVALLSPPLCRCSVMVFGDRPLGES